jgi:hypothetical protein
MSPDPDVFGIVIGFGIDGEAQGHVLVQYEDWDDDDDKIWMPLSDVEVVPNSKPVLVDGVTVSDDDEVEVIQPANTPSTAAPVIPSPTLVPVQGADAGKSTRGATVRHDFFGDGCVLGMVDKMVRVDFGGVNGIKDFLPLWLELVAPAPASSVHPLDEPAVVPVLRVGDKARHASQGVGLITHIDGDLATVAFASGEFTVPLSSLEPAA